MARQYRMDEVIARWHPMIDIPTKPVWCTWCHRDYYTRQGALAAGDKDPNATRCMRCGEHGPTSYPIIMAIHDEVIVDRVSLGRLCPSRNSMAIETMHWALCMQSAKGAMLILDTETMVTFGKDDWRLQWRQP